MDLWDVLKLIVRRWYVSVPLLLVSLATAIGIGATTKPDYVATSNLTLLPPTLRDDPASGRAVNPWTVDTLMGAVVTRLNSKTQHEDLAAEGFSPIWTASPDMNFRSQLVLEVTAKSAEEARATTRRLHAIAIAEVAADQQRYHLRPGQEITAVAFDQGENVNQVSKKIYRLMIAVAGAGIILSTGFVIALDALLRWRSNRRAAAVPASAARAERQGIASVGPDSVTPLAASSVSPKPDILAAAGRPAIAQPAADARASSSNGSSADTAVLPAPKNGDVVPAVAVEFRVTAVKSDSPSSARAETPVGDTTSKLSDATIVLPLSHTEWGGRDEQKKRRDR